MASVLLKNKTKEIMVLNVGDRAVAVTRHVPHVTKSGQTGVKRVTNGVSSSITLMPGESKAAPSLPIWVPPQLRSCPQQQT